MKYVSLFSDIEAATVAWEPLGWKPVCFAEFDEFPSSVLAERYPEVPNIGDVTKMDWKKYRNKVDLVVGGSPCQYSFEWACERCGRTYRNPFFTCYPREFWKDNKKRAGEVCEKCRNEIDYDQVRRRKAKAGEAS